MIFSIACTPREAVIFGKYNARDIFSDRRVAALCIAAAQGDIAKIDELVQAGVDVNTRGEEGLTPLYWPLEAKNREGFKRLLEHGADAYVTREKEKGRAVVSAAAQAEDPEYLIMILDHGGEVNWVDPHGHQPLLVQTIVFHAPAQMKILLERGADMNAQDGFHATALIEAAATCQFEIALSLLEMGADYTLKDNANNTVMDILERYSSNCDPARQGDYQKLIEYFKARGIEIHPKVQE